MRCDLIFLLVYKRLDNFSTFGESKTRVAKGRTPDMMEGGRSVGNMDINIAKP